MKYSSAFCILLIFFRKKIKIENRKNKELYFLSFQGSYSPFQIALFHGAKCIAQHTLEQKPSAHLIPVLQKMLTENNIELSDISFIALDQGPGAFTSLRVTLTTANALSFAKKIPLIGYELIFPFV